MQHGDVLDQYRRLRAISVRHHSAALDHLARPAMLEQARRLGLADGQALLVGSEEEMTLVFDLAVHTARPGRTRAIDRYAKTAKVSPGSEEAGALRAICRARFSLWKIDRRHEVAGLVVSDILRGGETWLMDEGLSECGQPGLAFASRLCWPASFAMTCGILVPMDAELVEDAFLEGIDRLPPGAPEQLADEPRFAVAIYRAAINSGMMDRVRHRETAAAA